MEFSSKFADKVVRLRHGKLDRIELLDQSTMKHHLGSQDKILDRNPNKSASQSSGGEDRGAKNLSGENQGTKNSNAQNSGA